MESNAKSPSPSLCFEGFRLDLPSGELWKGDQRLKLAPQPAKVLACLAERSGALVTREELARQVWGEAVHVDFEHGLNFCIRQIRAALQDDVEAPRFIETVPRRGYRFLVPVSAGTVAGSSPHLPVAAGGGGWAPRWTVIGLALALTSTLVVALAWSRWGTPVAATPRPVERLAVLPILNLSTEHDDDYMAQTITEAIAAEMSHLDGLQVRSDVPSGLAQKHGSAAAIGREIGADAVLLGRMARFGDQLWITVKLVQVEPERYLWAETYTRDRGDPLAWHAALARDVRAEVGIKLRQPHPPPLGYVPTSEAGEAYLRGQYFWGQQTSRGLVKAIDFYRLAAEKDPRFALAYAGLAESYIQLEAFGMMPPQEAHSLARQAALKSMELDHALAQPHIAMGFINLFYDWRWQAAESECDRALEIDPAFARAHLVCAGQLAALGRAHEAVRRAHRAFELEPASLNVNLGLISHLYLARRYDEAIERLEDLIDAQPEMPSAHVHLGLARHARKDYRGALQSFRRAQSLGHSSPSALALMAASHAALGETGEARRLLAASVQAGAAAHVSPFLLARVHVCLGERDSAFRLLDEAVARRSRELVFLKLDPSLDELRADPRFPALLARVGLPD